MNPITADKAAYDKYQQQQWQHRQCRIFCNKKPNDQTDRPRLFIPIISITSRRARPLVTVSVSSSRRSIFQRDCYLRACVKP
ncbi:Serpentine receptor [Trichinella spiralis]|uniref:Serpentine receptor n=1 Tax=Trichinella spiralis TaxID=6334 RepID=A0ABR3KWA1_TRISP